MYMFIPVLTKFLAAWKQFNADLLEAHKQVAFFSYPMTILSLKFHRGPASPNSVSDNHH